MKYKLTEKERYQYAGILILEVMINDKRYFPVLLEGNDSNLEPIFVMMMAKNLVKIDNNMYVPTEDGRKLLEMFYGRFTEYINVYDLYCAVDLAKAEFAFSSWFDFEDDDVWNTFINDDRFEDVRVAVCEYKGINPIEMVFMSYVASNTFDLQVEGWQFDIASGLIWDEILEICNTNISREQLDEQGAMEAIIEMGTKVMFEKKKKQAEIDAEIEELDEIIDNPEYEDVGEDEEEEEIVEYVTVVEDVYYEDDYYDPYWDIGYVSPIWVAPILWY